MADRPAQICQLKKGALICDQQGFVDTFNWVAQSMANLEGGENCEVNWTLPDHPTIDVTASDEAGNGGGGIEAAVYDVYADSQDDKYGITIEYTDDRNNSFIPFPDLSSLSGVYVSDIDVEGNNLDISYSDGTSKTEALPTPEIPNAVSSITRVSADEYTDQLSIEYTQTSATTVPLYITLSGNIESSASHTSFQFLSASDSNVQIEINGSDITIGVYYI